MFFTRCDVFCDLLQYTRTENVICLFYTIQIKWLIEDLGGFWGMKKEKPVRWRDLTWIWRHLYVCALIDNGRNHWKWNQWKYTQKSINLLCWHWLEKTVGSIKVGYKPINTLSDCFPKPKDKIQTDQRKGVVYKIGCLDCNFVHIGQTDS